MSGHFLSGVRHSPSLYGLQIVRTSRLLVRGLELAGDSTQRKKGLLGRNSLDPDIGFVIAPSQGIHTFGMQFAIGVIGVSRDGRVVRIKTNVPARRLVFALRAFAIIEVAAGVAERSGLVVGDQLLVVETASAASDGADGITR